MVMSNPRAEMPEEAPIVLPPDGVEHGYYGSAPDTDDDHKYTLAGVCGRPKNEEAPATTKPAARRASKSKGGDE